MHADRKITVEFSLRELAEIALSVTATTLDLAEHGTDRISRAAGFVPDERAALVERIVFLCDLVRKIDKEVRAHR